MIRLGVSIKEESGERQDIDRIIQVCATNNYSIDRLTAYLAWTDYSESYAAGWMNLLSQDNKLLEIILNHTIELQEQ